MKTDSHKDLAAFVGQKFYPCVAAVQSVAKNDYLIHEAKDFGSGSDREGIRKAICDYLRAWMKTRSTTYTLLVTFPNDEVSSEDEFETKLWSELSSLTSVEEQTKDWAQGWSQNPNDPNFTICIGGYAFFVVGIHPLSSRPARRFPYPTIIFNVFDQFEDITAQGQYESMVKKNREREMKFSGNLNPMVEKYGDKRESIQFSGKNNPEDWKCPFHFKAKEDIAK